MPRVRQGESIAVNGCCLTVVSCKNRLLEFDLSEETLRRTALSRFGQSQEPVLVNLERSLKPSDRLGGHFVLGHVDGVGRIGAIRSLAGSVVYTIGYPKRFARWLIEKGSIAVDGISLTVCGLKNSSFQVHIIPETLKKTHLSTLKKGDPVNLEFDVLGKYAERRHFLSARLAV